MTDIQDFYDKHISGYFKDGYDKKYLRLPIELDNKLWRWKGKDLSRIIALLEFREYMLKLNRVFDYALTFNIAPPHKDPEIEYLQYKKIDNFNFQDDQLKYDLHEINLEKKNYDFCMVNQTLEHLYNPFKCMKNVCKHMKVGGIFYANVPSMNIMHDTPWHFVTGFTPMGLGMLMEESGFEVLNIGQWGNKDYLNKLLTENGWNDWHSLGPLATYNDVNNPVITWCFATKK